MRKATSRGQSDGGRVLSESGVAGHFSAPFPELDLARRVEDGGVVGYVAVWDEQFTRWMAHSQQGPSHATRRLAGNMAGNTHIGSTRSETAAAADDDGGAWEPAAGSAWALSHPAGAGLAFIDRPTGDGNEESELRWHVMWHIGDVVRHLTWVDGLKYEYTTAVPTGGLRVESFSQALSLPKRGCSIQERHRVYTLPGTTNVSSAADSLFSRPSFADANATLGVRVTSTTPYDTVPVAMYDGCTMYDLDAAAIDQGLTYLASLEQGQGQGSLKEQDEQGLPRESKVAQAQRTPPPPPRPWWLDEDVAVDEEEAVQYTQLLHSLQHIINGTELSPRRGSDRVSDREPGPLGPPDAKVLLWPREGGRAAAAGEAAAGEAAAGVATAGAASAPAVHRCASHLFASPMLCDVLEGALLQPPPLLAAEGSAVIIEESELIQSLLEHAALDPAFDRALYGGGDDDEAAAVTRNDPAYLEELLDALDEDRDGSLSVHELEPTAEEAAAAAAEEEPQSQQPQAALAQREQPHAAHAAHAAGAHGGARGHRMFVTLLLKMAAKMAAKAGVKQAVKQAVKSVMKAHKTGGVKGAMRETARQAWKAFNPLQPFQGKGSLRQKMKNFVKQNTHMDFCTRMRNSIDESIRGAVEEAALGQFATIGTMYYEYDSQKVEADLSLLDQMVDDGYSDDSPFDPTQVGEGGFGGLARHSGYVDDGREHGILRRPPPPPPPWWHLERRSRALSSQAAPPRASGARTSASQTTPPDAAHGRRLKVKCRPTLGATLVDPPRTASPRTRVPRPTGTALPPRSSRAPFDGPQIARPDMRPSPAEPPTGTPSFTRVRTQSELNLATRLGGISSEGVAAPTVRAGLHSERSPETPRVKPTCNACACKRGGRRLVDARASARRRLCGADGADGAKKDEAAEEEGWFAGFFSALQGGVAALREAGDAVGSGLATAQDSAEGYVAATYGWWDPKYGARGGAANSKEQMKAAHLEMQKYVAAHKNGQQPIGAAEPATKATPPGEPPAGNGGPKGAGKGGPPGEPPAGNGGPKGAGKGGPPGEPPAGKGGPPKGLGKGGPAGKGGPPKAPPPGKGGPVKLREPVKLKQQKDLKGHVPPPKRVLTKAELAARAEGRLPPAPKDYPKNTAYNILTKDEPKTIVNIDTRLNMDRSPLHPMDPRDTPWVVLEKNDKATDWGKAQLYVSVTITGNEIDPVVRKMKMDGVKKVTIFSGRHGMLPSPIMLDSNGRKVHPDSMWSGPLDAQTILTDDEKAARAVDGIEITMVDTSQHRENQLEWLQAETKAALERGENVLWAWCYGVTTNEEMEFAADEFSGINTGEPKHYPERYVEGMFELQREPIKDIVSRGFTWLNA